VSISLTREELSQFLTSQRAIRAFEKLFDDVATISTIINISTGETLTPSTQSVLDQLPTNLRDSIMLAATSPRQEISKSDYGLSPVSQQVTSDFDLKPWT